MVFKRPFHLSQMDLTVVLAPLNRIELCDCDLGVTELVYAHGIKTIDTILKAPERS